MKPAISLFQDVWRGLDTGSSPQCARPWRKLINVRFTGAPHIGRMERIAGRLESDQTIMYIRALDKGSVHREKTMGVGHRQCTPEMTMGKLRQIEAMGKGNDYGHERIGNGHIYRPMYLHRTKVYNGHQTKAVGMEQRHCTSGKGNG